MGRRRVVAVTLLVLLVGIVGAVGFFVSDRGQRAEQAAEQAQRGLREVMTLRETLRELVHERVTSPALVATIERLIEREFQGFTEQRQPGRATASPAPAPTRGFGPNTPPPPPPPPAPLPSDTPSVSPIEDPVMLKRLLCDNLNHDALAGIGVDCSSTSTTVLCDVLGLCERAPGPLPNPPTPSP